MSTLETAAHEPHESMEPVFEFLRKLNASVDTIDWDRDLIDARILDSLAFVEFLLLMEELTGEQIDLSKTDVSNFRTLNRINALITKGAGHAHA
ncbi:acyl carrier protein [Streptomyces maoxianensis]|uniref:Acyl carrier protein n=1 Tax=Streptomyces maoxianensis TaxID=1459942 RepID=A0ABV9GFU5_9ACTN